jgi:ketosteroid isomerase-like protein
MSVAANDTINDVADRLHATGHAGQSISMRVCIVIKVDPDGLIKRIDEYFDPAGIAPLID